MSRAARSLAALWIGTVIFGASARAQAPLRIGFVDRGARQGLSGEAGMGPRNAAACAYARTQGQVARLAPRPDGGWTDTDGAMRASEEFDVIWYHQGDEGDPNPGEAVTGDLLSYVEGGGALILSGSAGSLLNQTGIEPTSLRVLSTTTAPYLSGIVVREAYRNHPIFTGFDTSKAIILTSLGGNALSDFYGTAGPHGELLGEGNAGVGERPLVEYKVGAGHVLFVGWRLPDFTTATDPYRPNMVEFFGNVLRYMAQVNANRARLARPAGETTYARLLSVPFLRAAKPEALAITPSGEKTAVVLSAEANLAGGLPVPGGTIVEQAAGAEPIKAQALALTLVTRDRPAAAFVERQRVALANAEKADAAAIGGLRIIKPAVEWLKAPLKPLKLPDVDQSVLLGRSPFMAPGEGLGDIKPAYEPVEAGGFRIAGSKRTLNRPIVEGMARLWTGDAPMFRLDATTAAGCYSEDRFFPLWPRADAASAQTYPVMGTLTLSVPGADGKPRWMHEMDGTTTTFWPGYTQYLVKGEGWTATITATPTLRSHGMVCRVEFDQPTALGWRFGGIWWSEGETNANRAEISGNVARFTEANLPKGLVIAGWDGDGEGKTVAGQYGQEAELSSRTPKQVYHIVAVWGVTEHDRERAEKTMARLDTPNSAAWPEARDRLKREWFDAAIGRALEPERHFAEVMATPAAALKETMDWWDARRQEFQVKTPDAQLNALANWNRCISEYHRRGPGLVLGVAYWTMYSHISTGWKGKQWGGDHAAMDDCLRLYGAFQQDNGFVQWVSPSLQAFNAENNTPYWVDQVWWQYAWTGDKQFVRDMWPMVRKAVAWMRASNDPDGDGLFRDWYEYWNCDSNGKGPKAAAPTAMAWAMMDRAAKMAAVVGDGDAEREYRTLADKTKAAVMRELWREDQGHLGSIGWDDIWRGHPQTWEEYLAINVGLLDAEQGRRAMRWLAAHYGFEPQPGVHLLACSDWYPIRWSCQWVPTGDTCLAVLAGMKSGDAALWWPYLKTVVGSAFKSEFPGMNMGISNYGAGGGDREDVDSDDPPNHVIVRGLFGIEPALHEGRIDICPAFPAEWTTASITTPDVSYEYRRVGGKATFRIRTPKPVVKRVRANLSGPEAVTRSEKDSTVTVAVGKPPAPPGPAVHPPIMLEKLAPAEKRLPHLDAVDKPRQILFDLSGAYNKTIEEAFNGTGFIYDASDGPSPVAGWWGNPPLTRGASPARVLEAGDGVTFLVAPRPRPDMRAAPKDLVAVSSWRPFPLPGGAVVAVGARCEKLWLLLQCYVHPMKNYIPNGEVVLRYDDGSESVVSLIPPLNLDAYFQHFSVDGYPVPLDRIAMPGGFSFVHTGLSSAHADALEVACDGEKTLASVTIRATCSEGVIGVLGMTALQAK
jgi:hypothetical protein